MNRWAGLDEVVAVAGTGNFVSAARRLGVSTSQVSRAVARIEQQLGIPIFIRTTRAVSLTKEGELLVDRFCRIIADRDEAFVMLNIGGEPQGSLRLTCSHALGTRFVAPIVLKYTMEFPRLSVHLDLSNRNVDIAAEAYDLAIRTGPMADSRLIRTQIGSRRILTCAAPAYLDRCGTPATIDDLGKHESILGSAPIWNFTVNKIKQSFKPLGRFACDNGEVVKEAAISGMGICHLPEFYLHDAIEDRALVTILEDLSDDHEPIWAVYPERRHLLPKVQVLIQRLRKGLRSLGV